VKSTWDVLFSYFSVHREALPAHCSRCSRRINEGFCRADQGIPTLCYMWWGNFHFELENKSLYWISSLFSPPPPPPPEIKTCSGWSPMQGMIPLPMLITPQSLVWLEGLYCSLVPICVKLMYTLRCSTRRIVGIATVSRPEHRIAQTRELACTKIVLPQVIARGLHLVCFMYFIYILCAFKTWTSPRSPMTTRLL
jgi:hypothetical protein